MGIPSMPELIVILLIVVLLFGAKKIPDLAKGLGSGIKNFKKALNEDEEAEQKKVEADKTTTTETTSESTKA